MSRARAMARRMRSGEDAASLITQGNERCRAGDFETALSLYRGALKISPGDVSALSNLGHTLLQMGRLEEALERLDEAIRREPRHALALFNRGAVLVHLRRFVEAEESFRRAAERTPRNPDLQRNLAEMLVRRRAWGEALTHFKLAADERPGFAAALAGQGRCLVELDRSEEGLPLLMEGARLEPSSASVQTFMGLALQRLKRFDEALEALQEAVRLAPRDSSSHLNLGTVLIRLERLDEAERALRTALEVDPRDAKACMELGDLLYARGRPEEAEALFTRGLEIEPDNPDLHLNLALVRLARGDMRGGWAEYEHRFRAQNQQPRELPVPLWDGTPLQGRRLLVLCEQGMGDVVHFSRFLHRLPPDTVVEAYPPLARLLRASLPHQVVERGETVSGIHCYLPLLSLARILGTEADSIPADVPYLRPETADVDSWRERLSRYPGLRVGLAWAGNVDFARDHLRSIPLHLFAPLAGVEGVTWFSLQKGRAAAEARPPGLDLVDLTDALIDFAETAALIANLDLVISVDTSVAHLAGAMGVPVWTLIPYAPDWRWQWHREDSPWYPTMRLFRQEQRGEWAPVIHRAMESLPAFFKQRAIDELLQLARVLASQGRLDDARVCMLKASDLAPEWSELREAAESLGR